MAWPETVVTASYDGSVKIWRPAARPSLKLLEACDGEELDVPPQHAVHRAFYGDSARHWDQSRGRDVTEKVRWLLFNGERLKSSCEVFGDPLPGTSKTLLVEIGIVEETSSSSMTLPKCEEQIDVGEFCERGMMSIAFSSDGALILTACYDGVAALWCARTGICKKEFQVDSDPWPGLYTALFSPDEAHVLTCNATGTARLWCIADGSCQWELVGHDEYYMRYATFSPDGCRVATASSDQTAKLYLVGADGGAPEEEWTFHGHEGWVNTVVFTADSSKVLTSSADWTARLWCVDTGKLLIILKGHEHFVRTAVFSPDSTRVLTSSFDYTAKVWSSDVGECVCTLYGHEEAVNSAMFSADGTIAVTSSRDWSSRLWCLATGACLQILRGHRGFVVWAAFAPPAKQTKRKAEELALLPALEQTVADKIARSRNATDQVIGKRCTEAPEVCSARAQDYLEDAATTQVSEQNSEGEEQQGVECADCGDHEEIIRAQVVETVRGKPPETSAKLAQLDLDKVADNSYERVAEVSAGIPRPNFENATAAQEKGTSCVVVVEVSATVTKDGLEKISTTHAVENARGQVLDISTATTPSIDDFEQDSVSICGA